MPISKKLQPFWSAPGAALYLGDVRECLRQLPTRSVHCCVTSPPYWGLRDYGTDHQIGMEDTPEEYIVSMVDVFGEVRRVLRDDGALWLNLGDTFDCGQQLIPARVALALVADGWRLVQDIIWYAPNKMPESVTNRCTKSHEHIFLLAKGSDYYFDSVAIMEKGKSGMWDHSNGLGGKHLVADPLCGTSGSGFRTGTKSIDGTVNKRDVWIVPTRGYPGLHYACFSPELITPCILAGTSEHGCCAECGRPYERVVARSGGIQATKETKQDRSFVSQRNGLLDSGSTLGGTVATRETVGWRKACGCQTTEIDPCVVLDPFVGSGTTVATAIQLGRAGVGIDLSEVYLRENAVPRIEAVMRGEKVGRRTVVVPADTPPQPQRLR